MDVDIKGYFDSIPHQRLMELVKERIADGRVLSLIESFLKQKVMDTGGWIAVEEQDEGTPQGGVISPLLANIYLNPLDHLMSEQGHQMVRYADDMVILCPTREAVEEVLKQLGEWCSQAGLELHPEKTHLLEFGAYAAERRRARGQRKPETFNFLGFTHICGKKRNGQSTVLRHTMRQRLQAKLHEVKAELRRRKHRPVCEQGAWLRRVVGGHIRYYGVPTNDAALYTFRFQVARLWLRTLRQRSQRHRLPWARMRGQVDRWLPPARVCHPYPFQRVWRHNLRQEPDAGNPLVRICGGGAQ